MIIENTVSKILIKCCFSYDVESRSSIHFHLYISIVNCDWYNNWILLGFRFIQSICRRKIL